MASESEYKWASTMSNQSFFKFCRAGFERMVVTFNNFFFFYLKIILYLLLNMGVLTPYILQNMYYKIDICYVYFGGLMVDNVICKTL